MKLLRAAAQVLTAVPVAVVLHDCVFTVCRVPDPSMSPTLQGGEEYVFVDKFSIRSWMAPSPELKGEVVCLVSPNEPDKVLLKRVIGTPGDWISVADKPEPVQVPKGHCWVEGDDKKSNRTKPHEKHFVGGLVSVSLASASDFRGEAVNDQRCASLPPPLPPSLPSFISRRARH